MMVKEEYGGQHLIATEQDKEGNFQHSLTSEAARYPVKHG